VALKPWLLGALLGGSLALSCRDVSVCADGAPCLADGAPGQSSTGGVEASDAAGRSSSGAVSSSAGARERGSGSGGAGHDAAAGGEGDGQPNECPTGFAECDDSALSVCETNLLRSVRHCGACANECAGLCAFGTCKVGEQLFEDSVPGKFVATQSNAFGVMSSVGSDDSFLYMFDQLSGAAKPVTRVKTGDTELSLGIDRVYYYSEYDSVFSVTFDGGTVEPVLDDSSKPLSVYSFGATSRGLYYVTADDEQIVWRLFYRANHSPTWQPIHEGSEFAIESAGLDAVALVTGSWDAENPELLLAIGEEVTRCGPLPDGWGDLIIAGDEAVVLTTNPSELWWFDDTRDPIHYAVDAPRYAEGALVLSSEGVAFKSQALGMEWVREYSNSGPTSEWAVGIPRTAGMVLMSRTHVWYDYYPSYIEPPLLLRSRWLEASDF
jgi:hypothetical protein